MGAGFVVVVPPASHDPVIEGEGHGTSGGGGTCPVMTQRSSRFAVPRWLPGRMEWSFAAREYAQASKARLFNAEPFPVRRTAGRPRSARSGSRTSIMRTDGLDQLTWTASVSRLNSSTTAKHRELLPKLIVLSTKSGLQLSPAHRAAHARCGGTGLRFRLPLRCTARPSSR